MLLGEIFQSLQAWQKLSSMRMRPQVAYKILKYTKEVSAEYELVEKQRVALIHRITNTEEGQEARVEPETPEFEAYMKEFNEIMLTESDLRVLNVSFEKVLDSVGEGQDDVLSVTDMATLEPFFAEKEVEEPVEPPAVAGKIG